MSDEWSTRHRHLAPAAGPVPNTIRTNSGIQFYCVSASQQKHCPDSWPVIPNGVELPSFRPRWRKCNFALMLGRICPEKGFEIGLDAASHAGIPLMIGGEVFGYEAHRQYFEEQVLPRLEGTRHRWLGPLGLERAAAYSRRRVLFADPEPRPGDELISCHGSGRERNSGDCVPFRRLAGDRRGG